jgi:hypothetical protein
VGTGLSYNIPFMTNDDRATYVCKITVNNNCLTKLAYTTLNGQCHNGVLPVQIQLSGISKGASNVLRWNVDNDRDVILYTLERKQHGSGVFAAIVEWMKTVSPSHQFIDDALLNGTNIYRLKVHTSSGQTFYSNQLSLAGNMQAAMFVYPNPVTNEFVLNISSSSISSYSVMLLDATGKIVMTHTLNNITRISKSFNRNGLKSGVYLLQILNRNDNRKEAFKLIFN